MEDTVRKLFAIGAVKFGEFKLKSGIMSPVYFDLRVIVSYPELMTQVSELLWEAVKDEKCSFKSVCGVPYTALPLATCIAVSHNVPMLIRRKEAKDYGTKKMIEGHFQQGDDCLVVEDVVTSGGSVFETAEALASVGLKVTNAVVLLDREQGGSGMLQSKGIRLKSVFTLTYILKVLQLDGSISHDMVKAVEKFLCENQIGKPPDNSKAGQLSNIPNTEKVIPFKDRINIVKNNQAKKLLSIMEGKRTNLAFSADVCSSAELLSLADSVGPYICMLKTHIDILNDFDPTVTERLKTIAQKHNFLIFEDRKFADIGNTVKQQYKAGMYKIVDWADIVNAHSVPGKGVIDGLAEEGRAKSKACILIAQMSSKGALLNDGYTKATVEMAKESDDFVIGFICTSRVSDDPIFLHFTPGVNMASQGDELGQQYLTPQEVIGNRKCDVIIVGRGIYKAQDPVLAAKSYRDAGFKAYLDSLSISL